MSDSGRLNRRKPYGRKTFVRSLNIWASTLISQVIWNCSESSLLNIAFPPQTSFFSIKTLQFPPPLEAQSSPKSLSDS